MDRSIASLVWAARALVDRFIKAQNLGDDMKATNLYRMMVEKDEQLRRTYVTTLKVRASEVVEYAERLGFVGASVKQVQEDPLAAAYVLNRVASGDSLPIDYIIETEPLYSIPILFEIPDPDPDEKEDDNEGDGTNEQR